MKKLLIVLIAVFMTTISSFGRSGQVLILMAHPNFEDSKANKAMMESLTDLEGINFVHLDAKDYSLESYRSAVEAASVIVLQFPVYWLSAPHTMKKWIDEVFTPLSGEVGGKELMIAATTGSEYEAYRSGGRNRFTMDELLRPFEASAHHAGMGWITPFVLYSAGDDDSVAEGAARYRQVISSLVTR